MSLSDSTNIVVQLPDIPPRLATATATRHLPRSLTSEQASQIRMHSSNGTHPSLTAAPPTIPLLTSSVESALTTVLPDSPSPAVPATPSPPALPSLTFVPSPPDLSVLSIPPSPVLQPIHPVLSSPTRRSTRDTVLTIGSYSKPTRNSTSINPPVTAPAASPARPPPVAAPAASPARPSPPPPPSPARVSRRIAGLRALWAAAPTPLSQRPAIQRKLDNARAAAVRNHQHRLLHPMLPLLD